MPMRDACTVWELVECTHPRGERPVEGAIIPKKTEAENSSKYLVMKTAAQEISHGKRQGEKRSNGGMQTSSSATSITEKKKATIGAKFKKVECCIYGWNAF